MSARPREAHDPPELHVLEREVMDEVWRLGETPGRAVLDGLNARSDRVRAYTTIMTIFQRLYDKGPLRPASAACISPSRQVACTAS